MHWYLLGTAALVMSGMVVIGAVAVTTGWLLPWLRLRTTRPELWGYGAMCGGMGLLLFMSWGALDAFGDTPVLHRATGITGMLMLAAGSVLQMRSSRPRVDT
ncbi:hypothetical protein ADL01_32420 [Streptomyces sp. NRRL WC-3618]|jgi:hypothetical protein|uniref:hypothetical protein n=1 Tax=Streptomyces sp. NRRL WC-3618 TaxID=1519490 RepID=UPI0006AFB282|nr:hypothetical protein [Streptomyces sp. NRRL WC-3618]KOV61004.1 hypothetical protein ADL01_32420 [Streptomyces sp. NRRL WC-3618]